MADDDWTPDFGSLDAEAPPWAAKRPVRIAVLGAGKIGSTFASQIEEHMAVVGSDGEHVSTVDKVEGDRIKLTKQDDPDGSGQHHHYLPVSAVASVEGGEVRLNMPGARAKSLATMTGGSEAGKGMGSMGAG